MNRGVLLGSIPVGAQAHRLFLNLLSMEPASVTAFVSESIFCVLPFGKKSRTPKNNRMYVTSRRRAGHTEYLLPMLAVDED